MRKCILCNELTNGSIGAAGYAWSFICQPCKDKEDSALADRMRGECLLFNKVFDKIFKEAK
jgi:hypothetical protein